MPIIFLNLTKITNNGLKIDRVYGHNSNKKHTYNLQCYI